VVGGLGDYDYKFFIPDTPRNREMLREKGITQVETDTDVLDWYVSPLDIDEDYVDLEPEERLEAVVEKMIWGRRMFKELIDKTFPNGYLMIYGSKKWCEDETCRVWGTDDFWEALERLRKWIEDNFEPYLEFGNDDLNGWTLVGWKVLTKELHELAQKCSEIIS